MTDSGRRARPLDQEQVTTAVLEWFKEAEPALAWMQMLANLHFARIVYAAVKLRIVDALRKGPKTAHEVASVTSTDEVALHRLLRALSAGGVVVESKGGRFGLTPAGALLVSDGKPSFFGALLDFFEPELVPLDGLVRTVATGKPAFEERHGTAFYDYLAQKAPDGGAQFDASMNVGAALRARALLDGYDFSGVRTVVDIGGGEGALLTKILEVNPHLRGVVFERPRTAARARARLAQSGLAARCEVTEGDFFSSLPSGCDVYVLSFILHNWDDAQCVALLSQCRRAMGDGAVLLIVEQLRVPTTEASIVEYFNLRSLELLAGRERTKAEFRVILKNAGFRLAGVTQSPGAPFCVMEARPTGRTPRPRKDAPGRAAKGARRGAKS
jgi:ubiquinone/menaquinone biosynthesis C-methylase UbiE